MSIQPVGPLTPYINPDMLLNAPTGISWSTIPAYRSAPEEAKLAEQYNICQRATAQADAYCNQVLRACLDTETQYGPDYYTTFQQDTGNIRMILSRRPVLGINSVEVSPANAFPRQWVTVTTGYYAVERPVMGVYGSSAPTAAGAGGQGVIIAPGYMDWSQGRKGYVIQITYASGWPHCGLTSAVTSGASSVAVDDCTGWSVATATGIAGATGIIYDTGGHQEVLQVTQASATAGPGTLTLSGTLQYPHPAGTVVSTLPASVQWACILFATAIALTRGATATTVHTIPGGGAETPALKGPDSLVAEGELLLHPLRRLI